jgi:hypothetical protein
MQIKITLRSHNTPIRRAIIKKTNKKCWEDPGCKEHLKGVGEKVN